MTPRFFVEFKFHNDATGRTYWLPLFVAADNPTAAGEITTATEKALLEHFKNVIHSEPIPEAGFTVSYIKHKFELHRFYKTEILNVDVWKFNDVRTGLSFNEHLEFIADMGPIIEHDVAKRIEAHKFPVRVIREGKFPIDFKEFLLINVVAQE